MGGSSGKMMATNLPWFGTETKGLLHSVSAEGLQLPSPLCQAFPCLDLPVWRGTRVMQSARVGMKMVMKFSQPACRPFGYLHPSPWVQPM